MTNSLPVGYASVRCRLLGHKVHYTRIDRSAFTPCARCGVAILDEGPNISRVAHTLSCFFGWHHYVLIDKRSGHNEYACEKCGHPLLLALSSDTSSKVKRFKKRVNYACGLFGHRVHTVKTESTSTEYACRCGHSFVKTQTELTVIRHPLRCVLLGHSLTVNAVRGEWTQYVCFHCGHPFLF